MTVLSCMIFRVFFFFRKTCCFNFDNKKNPQYFLLTFINRDKNNIFTTNRLHFVYLTKIQWRATKGSIGLFVPLNMVCLFVSVCVCVRARVRLCVCSSALFVFRLDTIRNPMILTADKLGSVNNHSLGLHSQWVDFKTVSQVLTCTGGHSRTIQFHFTSPAMLMSTTSRCHFPQMHKKIQPVQLCKNKAHPLQCHKKKTAYSYSVIINSQTSSCLYASLY